VGKNSVFNIFWHPTVETEILLSAAFTFLNRVTNCYKSGVNIMMNFGGTMTPEVLIPHTL
jgi:hypothetical protein